MAVFTESEERILNAYYPPRTGELGDDGDEETGKWSWEGWEHDELIPWTFSTWEWPSIDEEAFLAMYNAWNGENSFAFTSTDRFPPKEDSIHESYEYIVYLKNKIWRIVVNENMGLHAIWVEQELPKHLKIDEIQFKIIGHYWDEETEEVKGFE